MTIDTPAGSEPGPDGKADPEQGSDADHRAHPLLRLFRYARPHRGRMWLASACSVLNKIFDLGPPVLIGAAVDVIVQQQDSFLAGWGIVEVWDQLLVLSGITLAVWLLESGFEYLYGILWRNLSQTIEHELRVDAYRHLQDLELAYYEERSSGALMSVLSDDINQLERFLDIGANELLQLATTILVIGGAFVVLAPSVAWMALLPMPVIVWGSIRYQKILMPYYADVRERVEMLNHRLANNLGGITTIKAFTAEVFEVGQVERESAAYRDANRRAIRVSAGFVPLIRVLILFGFTATLLYGGMEAVEGDLTVGTYSVLVFMTQRLLWPLTRLGETLDQYQRAMASTTRVMALLDTPFRIRSGGTALPTSEVRGEIEIRDLTFAYGEGEDSESRALPGESGAGVGSMGDGVGAPSTGDGAGPAQSAPVLRDIDLHVAAGETVGIVGSTGSGKSTLVKLLLRLYHVHHGVIQLDGIDIEEIRLEDLRAAMGLVSQDVFLFHGTVRENIVYGSWDAEDEAIERAARLAEAHEFIQAMPAGYDTVVGERGQKLSGGQRQRIAIARAILKDPPVLILDEATSAVDNETEAAIQRSLDRISRDRTTLAIAHRLSTVRSADRICVLERGRVAEIGTHEELLARGGIYAGLWRVQTGEAVAVG